MNTHFIFEVYYTNNIPILVLDHYNKQYESCLLLVYKSQSPILRRLRNVITMKVYEQNNDFGWA